MKCPYCSYEESKVIDSRSADDGEKNPQKKRVPEMRQTLYHT